MFGYRVRSNSLPDSGFVDGSTDQNSAAYSPAMAENMTAFRPVVQVQIHKDVVRVQSEFTTGSWDNSFDGVAKYINQPIGGQAGNARTIGWSTGLRPRKESRTPLTGRVLVMNNMGVHPVVGQVGRDNRANRLRIGVESQTNDFQPLTTAEIARQFTGNKLSVREAGE